MWSVREAASRLGISEARVRKFRHLINDQWEALQGRLGTSLER